MCKNKSACKKKFTRICLMLYLSSFLIHVSCTMKCENARTMQMMDTVCTVNAFDDGTKELYDEIFSRLKTIENEFSVTKENSEVSRINSDGMIDDISDDFKYVLDFSKKISLMTDGAFNFSAGALIDLWGINTDREKIPSEAEIEVAIGLADFRNIDVDGKKVSIKKNGTKMNFGGIVKGYAADETCAILKKHNVRKAVVDLGGNIYVYGKKDGGEPWNVGIKDPNNPRGNPLLKISTEEISVVTSGIYERFFEKDGKRYHHIMDCKTGFPSDNGIASVTVVSTSSILADALSTAMFVLGKEKSLALLPTIEKNFGTRPDVIFIFRDGTFYSTTDKVSRL